jgi:LuxR family maltose regulon positive regulatory protein
VLTLLRQHDLAAAAHLAESHDLPVSRARVLLAQEDPSAALALLDPVRRQTATTGWPDERLKVLVVKALALHAHGEMDKAVQLMDEALALAQPGGFVRVFVDEGAPMARLLAEAAAHTMLPDYAGRVLAVCETEQPRSDDRAHRPPARAAQPLSGLLSQREIDVLRLMTEGLSNREISERLFLALSTVKGHNQTIFSKLQVQRRTEAVARARDLGLV